MPRSLINAQTRQESLNELTNPKTNLDILVVGGGITGAGIALDAASRGLTTGIIEAQDWASGTSSRSSKLAHGGLRYLMMLDFKLVREALTERDLLLSTTAPHLVKPVPFLYPLLPRAWRKPKSKKFLDIVDSVAGAVWQRPYIATGVGMYDFLAKTGGRKKALPIQKHYTKKGLKEVFPDFKDNFAVGAVRYYDAKVDDARLTLMIVRTAVAYGCMAASRTQLTGFTKDETGAVNGADIVDLETGKKGHINAKKVINATGVWTEDIQDLSGSEGGLKVLASKGIHIVVPKEKINGTMGVISMTEKSVLFIIPWERYWIIGTTDTEWKEQYKHPISTKTDVEYVLEHANDILEKKLTTDDVVGVFSGLRPLLQPKIKEGTSSAKVSREHTVASPVPNLVSIAGGKLTTYRVMAKDAVDFALGEEKVKEWACITQNLPLVGADHYASVKNKKHRYCKKYSWTKEQFEHLLNRYGSKVEEIAKLIDDDKSLNSVIAGAEPYIKAEIVYSVQKEGVLHLDDVMTTRTRLIFEVSDSGLSALNEIAKIIAPLLNWNKETTDKEIKSYKEKILAHKNALKTDNDKDASLVRVKAKDIVETTKLFEKATQKN